MLSVPLAWIILYLSVSFDFAHNAKREPKSVSVSVPYYIIMIAIGYSYQYSARCVHHSQVVVNTLYSTHVFFSFQSFECLINLKHTHTRLKALIELWKLICVVPSAQSVCTSVSGFSCSLLVYSFSCLLVCIARI